MMDTLANEVRQGNLRAVARALTHVENQTVQAGLLLDEFSQLPRQSHLIGITGPPGSGKSTLVTALAHAYRAMGVRVAILAIDPSSPFSGGAILGDRIRMKSLAGDKGVFIRSMAARGNMGGLARATSDAVEVLNAAGFARILIETVGAGQSEVEIASLAHTVLVVEAPGLGDDVQAIKAGILEIADILVVNKADLPQAEATHRALQAMLALAQANTADSSMAEGTENGVDSARAVPSLLNVVAVTARGVPELLAAIEAHREWFLQSPSGNRRMLQVTVRQLQLLLKEGLFQRYLSSVGVNRLNELADSVLARRFSMRQTVARELALFFDE